MVTLYDRDAKDVARILELVARYRAPNMQREVGDQLWHWVPADPVSQPRETETIRALATDRLWSIMATIDDQLRGSPSAS